MMIIIIIMHRKLLITDRTLFIKPRTKRLLRIRFGIDCLHPDVAMERGKSKGNCEGCMNVWLTDWLIDSISYQRSFNAELLLYYGKLRTRNYKYYLRCDTGVDYSWSRSGIRLQHNGNDQGMIPTWLLPQITLENSGNTKLHISACM
jgi:hypothetical protein